MQVLRFAGVPSAGSLATELAQEGARFELLVTNPRWKRVNYRDIADRYELPV
jgi:hypothetical protein